MSVLRSGWLMQGSQVSEFERLIAEYVGVEFAVAVNSGTSALTLVLMAAGLTAGDKVLMPSYSFVATANSTAHWGGEPVFVDIGPEDYNIDPSKISAATDSRTRAIVVVHQFGFTADMEPIMEIAEEHGLIVIEDAACSLGSTYRDRRAGSFGDAACLSFHPRKIITTGEGGIALTDSEEIAQRIRSLRNHGLSIFENRARPGCAEIGYNYRMTDMQAALGIAQFEKLDEIIGMRTRLAERYMEAISKMPLLRLPKWPEGSVPNFQSFVVELVDDSIKRDSLLAFLRGRGIECGPGIQPIHREPAYADTYSHIALPETTRAARRSFFLPLFPALTDKEQDFVIDSLNEALDECLAAKEA